MSEPSPLRGRYVIPLLETDPIHEAIRSVYMAGTAVGATSLVVS